MKINRLFEIVYILLDRKSITAKELAEKLEVSVRTIYRDIDTLTQSNIPLYANKGAGGGISILPNYILNKSVLTEEEQKEILTGLQSLRAAGYPDVESVLNKISSLFNKSQENWIDVDFSSWDSSKNMDDYFYMFKDAILNNKIVCFNYYGSDGKCTFREVEPLKLISKNKFWYIHGFCRMRNDYRFFKLSRMLDLGVTDKTFENAHNIEVKMPSLWETINDDFIEMKLKFSEEISYRVLDEFDLQFIEKDMEGNFIYSGKLYNCESTYTYLLSFGHYIEILAPKKAKENMKKYIAKIYDIYK